MNLRDDLTTIAERLSKIEGVLKQYVEAVNEANRRHDLQEHEPIAVNAVIRQPEAIETEQTAKQDTAQRTQNVIAVAACFAFVAALAYTVVAQLQLGELRKQTAAVYQQFEINNANASGENAQLFRQLNIAQQQAKAAQDNVVAIQRQTRQDQRPWIRFDMGGEPTVAAVPTVSWKIQVGNSLVVPVKFTNVGKTPAEQVQIVSVVQIVPRDSDPDLPKHHFTMGPPQGQEKGVAVFQLRTGTIFPGSHVDEMVTRLEIKNGKVVENILSVPEANDLVSTRSYLAIFGEVSYYDVFGIRHWTKFCKDGFPDGKDANNGKCANYYAVDNN